MRTTLFCVIAAVAAIIPADVSAHDGPPYPIVSDRVAGLYHVSIWTDPDTTDDGSAGGQFWVNLEGRNSAAPPSGTRATVAIRPLQRPGSERRAVASPVRGNIGNQFAALVMDHEGRFAVRVSIDGPSGSATIDSEVDATYDTRPPPYLLVVYVLPFLLAGLLWGRLIVMRRVVARRRA